MKRNRLAVIMAVLVGFAGFVGMRSSASAEGNQAFGFNAPLVSGFPGGRSAEITGGGSYKLPDFIFSGGSFRCLSDITAGLFNGCHKGQGVRWDPVMLLPSTPNGFKCTGAGTELLKQAQTNDKTVVLLADFYRQGDGNDESFTAQMIVSETDLDLDPANGIQNVWIQQIGCGTAVVNFN